jgi:hypothetical protein
MGLIHRSWDASQQALVTGIITLTKHGQDIDRAAPHKGAGAPGITFKQIAAGVAVLNRYSSDDYRGIADEDLVLKIWQAIDRAESQA